MSQYRKRPVVIDAEQWQGAPVRGVCTCMSDECGSAPHVHTIHGNQAVRLEAGDWVIPEGDGEHFYPCKNDIFARTYESVEGSLAETDALLDRIDERRRGEGKP